MSSKAYEIKQYLLTHSNETSTSIAKKFNTTYRYVKNCKREMMKGNMSIPTDKTISKNPKTITLDQELVERQRQAILADYRKRLHELHNRYDSLNQKFDELLQLREFTDVEVFKIEEKNSKKNQAVPIIQFSDWHVEERIDKNVTGGLNEYNPDIARKRVEKLSQNTLKLIKKERQDTEISKLVICLGGDFINNFLHEHDVQQNFMSPIEATMFAKELLKQSLLTIAEHSGVEKIHLLCIRGNHGRLTKRMSSSTDYKMNLEAMLYHTLKQELNDEIFEWNIPESELGYVEVFGKKIRAFHGHQIFYMGGVGDLTVPLNKFIQKQDMTVKADYNLCHHYHRFWTPTSTTSLNGSLCGYNSYALSLGMKYEPPIQSFQLLDSKRGFTVRVPIHVE
jgi:hypothetical protein